MTDQNEDSLTLLDALIISVIDEMPLEARVSIADLKEHEFKALELIQGKYIKYLLDQMTNEGNDELLKECRKRSGDESLDDVNASIFILREIWKQLRETHKLRVIK
jgi:hypothetical protein